MVIRCPCAGTDLDPPLKALSHARVRARIVPNKALSLARARARTRHDITRVHSAIVCGIPAVPNSKRASRRGPAHAKFKREFYAIR